ncbi:uncharacterized protein MONBRDRAFT_14866 [Monosiga brevicollis MX1]|uniref:Glycolipid transfer protein domain-containing protein n=1 Tax=Monosiga brevicollis TaxID=81824 RepID=A9UT04_MONBE|nr:uncharacterized protein MONBRDRAFT_14866 [Monosiga brevicollis MX1]EDQ91159.1 predicted protein [Monosiga brevicollis MX1]|eukprot:XP_001743581.1 hypothetical protein [Monosiga brevicollis MX1]
MDHSFTRYRLLERHGIPTSPFLAACRAIIPCVEKLGSTAFAPVKGDVLGNIEKIEKAYLIEPDGRHTLQALVQDELTRKVHTASGSATDALLWLQRALSFLCSMLEELANGNHNMSKAASNAYNSTLSKHHNWIVRGLFSVVLQSVPEYSTFIKTLGPANEHCVLEDMEVYVTALKTQLRILQSFYADNHLEV